MTNVTEKCNSLVDLLRLRAEVDASKTVYTYLVDGEEPGDAMSFGELDRQSRMIAAHLSDINAENERVLMLFAPGIEFLTGFFGCLYAGAIAVPTPSHNPTRLQRSLKRILAVAKGAEPTIGLTTSKLMGKVRAGFDEVPELKKIKWVIVDELDPDLAGQWVKKEIDRERLAFLQFTSGSTSLPKGVMLTHGNLLHNLECFDYGCGHDNQSVMLTWLPAFHDLGLIYGLLQPLFNGFQCYIISPVAFVQRPMRWLEAISRFRVTHTMGPNFAYESCLQKVTPEQLNTLDLRSWRMAMSAAEPVRKGTVDSFISTFAQCGFRSDSLCVAYGLAESTCLVSATHRRSSAGHYRERPRFLGLKDSALEQHRAEEAHDGLQQVNYLANCGIPKPDMELLIVDAVKKTSCQQNIVGEIWIKGPSVAQGYWQRPQESSETFDNYLASGEGPYLSTGDLGFMRDNELYFTGRLKDLIIIRGENHYPQDIEWSVDKCHPKLRQGCCAAFTIDQDEEELLVVVQEVQRNYKKDDYDDVITAIRKTISEEHDLKVYAIALLRTGTILKTSSGKIQRSACKVAFTDGTLKESARWYVKRPSDRQALINNNSAVTTASPARKVANELDASNGVVAFLRAKIDISSADYDKTLVELGLDSMDFTELLVHMQAELNVNISTEELYQQTLSNILGVVEVQKNEKTGDIDAQAMGKKPQVTDTENQSKTVKSDQDPQVVGTHTTTGAVNVISNRFTQVHFEPHGYTVRIAEKRDIPALIQLEEVCFPKAVCCTKDLLEARINAYSKGQVVLVKEGRVLGAVLTQRIKAVESLHCIHVNDVPELHDMQGGILQLFSLHVHPEDCESQLKGSLLEFVLYQASTMKGVHSVAGITRCSHYSEHKHSCYEAYLKELMKHAWLGEPELNMHTTHGAKIIGLIANYQPVDLYNHGYGVLFEYKLSAISTNYIGVNPDKAIATKAVDKQSMAKVIDFLKNKVDITEKDYGKTLAELGFDSMDFAELLVYIQESLDVDISTNDLYQRKLSDVLQLCNEPRRNSTNETQVDLPLNKRIRHLMRQFPEIVPLSINGDGCNTFWIHPLSGDVGVYNQIAARLNNAFKLIGIKARGFLSQACRPLSNPFEMAKYYTKIITAVDPVGPYHIAGFSLGGTIGYEVARQLQLQGKRVSSLVLVEAPFISGQEPELYQTTRRNNLLMNANFLLLTLLSIDQSFAEKVTKGDVHWRDFRITNDHVTNVSDDDLLEYLVKICKQKGINQSVDSLRFKLTSMADVHLANLQAIQDYCVEPLPYPGAISAWMFRTQSALATSNLLWNPDYLENIQQKKGSLLPLLQPWSNVLTNLETIVLNGDNHFDVMRSDDGIQIFINHCKKIFTDDSAVDVNRPDNTRNDTQNNTHNHTYNKATPNANNITPKIPAPSRGNMANPGYRNSVDSNPIHISKAQHDYVPIAIIGMSGRFPEADNVVEFWDNLKNGRSSITEVPGDRGWDINDYFDAKPQTPEKTYSKWGGFISNVDYFDPVFFGISPREAEFIDPSERIFLQEAWKAIEDAGYSATGLSGKLWGVFAYAKGDYSIHVQQRHDTYLSPTDSSAPSRLSYFLNLVGPAVSVDTACSSTLAAIVYACDSLTLGNSDVAIAGGGSVYTTPNLFVSSSQSLLFSPDGQCYTFDERANGTVLAEAIGVVVLKPLDKAVEDRDQIHGVIKGWGTNQDGKTNGLTAPSVTSQTRLETDIYRKFNIDPNQITMVEAHGTGTKLGDPIEVQALSDSFQKFTSKTGYCAIGSLKTNIGHAFGGAGVSGLIKVLLSLRHKQIPASLNCESINPYLRIENSPFFVNTALRNWDRVDNQPRCAAINSFGATGINAHLVVEEFLPNANGNTNVRGYATEAIDKINASNLHLSNKRLSNKRLPHKDSLDTNHSKKCIIVLSAKSDEQLRAQASHLLATVANQSALHLNDIAYTFQLGRVAMEERLATIVSSVEELTTKLTAYLRGDKRIDNFYYGKVKRTTETWAIFSTDDDMKKVITAWFEKEKYSKLLELWVKGMNVDWNKLYADSKPRRISLPTYPFAKERYWLSTPPKTGVAGMRYAANKINVIHPLLHANTSDFSRQRYSSVFTGNEFFLKDHVVNGRAMLPAVVYLEMARAAVNAAISSKGDKSSGICLHNVVWVTPLSLHGSATEVHIELYPEDKGQIAYEIYSESVNENSDPVVHSQGIAEIIVLPDIPKLNLKRLKDSCSRGSVMPNVVYENFGVSGVNFGPGHRGIEKIYVGDGVALAKLSLPAAVTGTLPQFSLHPSMLDSALQAVVGLLLPSDNGGVEKNTGLALPFALNHINIRGACVASMWASIRYSDGNLPDSRLQKYDIDLCDDQGNILVQMSGFSTRLIDAVSQTTETGDTVECESMMLEPHWEESEVLDELHLVGHSHVEHLHKKVVILCELSKQLQDGIKRNLGEQDYFNVDSVHQSIQSRYKDYACQVMGKIKTVLNAKPKGNVLMQLIYPNSGEQELLVGLSGLLKTAQHENPALLGQLIGVDPTEPVDALSEKIKQNALSIQDKSVQYREGKRWVAHWRELASTFLPVNMPWKEQGVYLITGGAGGLGMLFAKEIVSQVANATVILTGRSRLSEAKQTLLRELEREGAKLLYKIVDVTNKEAVDGLFTEVRNETGNINGIIHAAGVISDNYIVNKSEQELQDVINPKVTGLVNLDQGSQAFELDFFILFSSIAGSVGNPGQADYSTANAFMDAYAGYRNKLVLLQQRHGHTMAINWPLWKEGGMQIDSGIEKIKQQHIGLIPMQTATGLKAFYNGLALKKAQVMVLEGQLSQLRQLLLPTSSTSTSTGLIASNQRNVASVIAGEGIEEKALDYFRELIALHIKLPVQRIDAAAPLEKFGIDSIMAMELTNQLESKFGTLSKTLFFEYQTIQALAGYFLESYPDRLLEIVGVQDRQAGATIGKPANHSPVGNSISGARKRRRFQLDDTHQQQNVAGSRDIAIIGLTGRYPQAPDLQAFWANLCEGKDCITEIPADRWDHNQYFDSDKNKIGKSYSKWGGFIEGVDQFDPLFFNISPREAALMDPKERLFLEIVWNLFESTAYTRESLQVMYQNRVGVYVGAMYQQYHAFESDIVTESAISLSSYSSIANRVSHYFNFQGPSVAVDTMCSSALTSIHMACENLILGDCRLAVAGGVNLTIHPKKYIGLSQARIIGSHPDSRSFGNGDGYIPAEGVGAVLLKPLANAIHDGDTILGVIKSSTINHAGRSNGFAVPNPNAQSQLMEDNFKKSGIDPLSISYIESAANGSALGDPIEMAALHKVFKTDVKTNKVQPSRAIGSVKSNIGHAEAASGMSQLSKVILQLQHQQLVPSIKAEPLNPNLDFTGSPFQLQKELQEWKQPMMDVGGIEQVIPRRATISAFGAAGSNAHLIVEEYIPAETADNVVSIAVSGQVMVFSAKNQQRLLAVAQQMLEFIGCARDISLPNLAFTLQVGREAMESRLSMVVRHYDELVTGLKEYIESCNDDTETTFSIPVFTGDLEDDNSDILHLFSGNTGKTIIDSLVAENNLSKLALLWAKGGKISWQALHDGVPVKRIVLPTYPFDKRRCWIETSNTVQGVSDDAQVTALTDVLDTPDTGDASPTEQVTQIIAKLLAMEATELKKNKPLVQYGFDSVLLMQLVQQIQAHVNPSIGIADLKECSTIFDIVSALSRQESGNTLHNAGVKHAIPMVLTQFPELILLNQVTTGRPVFWLHAAIGGVEAYLGIAQKSQRPFYGIQAKGWMTDRLPLNGIQAMAAYYVSIIRSVQPEGPYDLGGYSIGGAIAYEITRQLQALEQTVDTIVMLDTLDTSGLKKITPSEKTNILQAVNTALGAAIQQAPEQAAAKLIHRDEVSHGQDEKGFLKQLIAMAKKRGLTKTEAQLSKQISQSTKVQQAYEIDKYEILPLPKPADVTCYYFRNQGGLFFGELEPYFSMEDIETEHEKSRYWEGWKQQLPDFNMTDVDSSNHMVLLSEPGPYNEILTFCEILYSESDVLRKRKMKLNEKANVETNVESNAESNVEKQRGKFAEAEIA